VESLFKRRTGCGTSENQIYINKDSKKPEPLTEEKKNNINQMVNDFASESLMMQLLKIHRKLKQTKADFP